MDITAEERQELIQDVINEITTQSTSIDELPVVEDLSETESLPSYRRGSSELVKVPITLLSQPAIDAAGTANTAASNANNAAALAEAAKTRADLATSEASSAAGAAREAASLAEQARDEIDSINNKATDAQNKANNLVNQVGNTTFVITTEDGYTNLEEKEPSTLYFCTEEDSSADDSNTGGASS